MASPGYPTSAPQEENAAYPTATEQEPVQTTGTTAPTARTVVHKLILEREPGDEDEKEEVEDLKQQKLAGDFSGEYGKRVYCKRYHRSLAPIKLIFLLGGRFPFGSVLQSDGTYLFKFHLFYPLGLMFLLSTGLMFCTLFFGIVNVALIALDIDFTKTDHYQYQPNQAMNESTQSLNQTNQTLVPSNQTLVPSNETSNQSVTLTECQIQREYEDILIQRYFIPIIFVYSSLAHGCIASVLMIKKRKYIAHYLTFWSKAVYTMHMDVSRRPRAFGIWALSIFVILVVFFTVIASFKVAPSVIGLPLVIGDLTLRNFIQTCGWIQEDTRTRRTLQILGAFILILTFTSSKSAILFFIYHCKSLQSAFAYWNGRVYAAVLRGGEFSQTEEGRTTFKLLFKDHCVLMDLMEGLDQVYAFTVESYFGCQIFSLFFEIYFFIRTAKHGDNRREAAYPEDIKAHAYFIRPWDWFPSVVMLILSMTIMVIAAKSAADVAEEAMAGLEVIRRKTMLGRKTDEELYFMLSMFSSYTAYKKMEISAGGYYYMNKDFIIGLVSAVLSYFIILYQFQPVLDKSFPGTGPTRTDREKYGMFLAEIEGLPLDHYETTTSQSDFWNEFRGP